MLLNNFLIFKNVPVFNYIIKTKESFFLKSKLENVGKIEFMN